MNDVDGFELPIWHGQPDSGPYTVGDAALQRLEEVGGLWREGVTISKVLALQASGPEFNFQNHGLKKKKPGIACTCNSSAGQADPGGSVSLQLGKFPAQRDSV